MYMYPRVVVVVVLVVVVVVVVVIGECKVLTCDILVHYTNRISFTLI